MAGSVNRNLACAIVQILHTHFFPMRNPIVAMIACLSLIGCSTLRSVQNNPGTQAAETPGG
jgi:hypothetical protein